MSWKKNEKKVAPLNLAIPPRAVEVERSVLGAILIDPEAWDVVSGLLNEQSFYLDAHQQIFSAMKQLRDRGKPIDHYTVVDQLNSNGDLEKIGGEFAITQLTTYVVNAANVEEHCRIILQKSVSREIIRVCSELIAEAQADSGDAFELLDTAQMKFGQVDEMLHFGEMIDVTTALVETFKQIEKWRGNDDPITGVRTGYPDLDKSTRGWQPGDLIILAARPSVGKTAFMLNLARNAAKSFQQEFLRERERLYQAGEKVKDLRPRSVAIFSLEMSVVRLVLRLLAAESEMILHKLQTGRLDDAEMQFLLSKGAAELSQLGIKFDDKPGLTIQKLRSKARKLKKKDNLGMIVIDYLQLMTGDKKVGSREQEISQISRQLKNLAMELDVPIIALSQLSRDVEKRNGEPMLSDLRESGAIEQDADVVCFLFKPSEAQLAEDPNLTTMRYLKIAKQRDGFLNKINLDFRGDIQLFRLASDAERGIAEVTKKHGPGAWRPVANPDLFTEPSRKNYEEDLF